ncbi:MAG: Crp/Fnr family transcriptional regulator, partial [Candidatus Cryptobacteroides sp.]
LLSQSSSDTLQRIAQVLVNMATEYGTPTKDGLEISIRFSHQDVANLLHVSRVTVTKAFQHLAQLNIIRRQQNRIVVSDLPRLEKIATDGLDV